MRPAFAFHRANRAEGHFPDPAGRAAGTTKRLELESSRFALDVPADAPKASGGFAAATYELFAGMIEFGPSIELIEIVTVTDARMERFLRRAGWPLRRVGKSSPPWKHHGCRGLPGGFVRCVGPHPQGGANLGTGALGSGHSSRCLASGEANVTAADRCGEPLFALKTYHAQARSHTSVTPSHQSARTETPEIGGRCRRLR